MKAEITPDLVYNILWEACDIMDKEEFACRVEHVYGECATIIANDLNRHLSVPCTMADIADAEVVD